jgi:hypothetical protein
MAHLPSHPGAPVRTLPYGENRISSLRSAAQHCGVDQGRRTEMSLPEQDAIAAFIRLKGVTRCPTACAAPTQAAVAIADRWELRRRAQEREAAWEAARQERLHRAWLRRVGPRAA